MAEELTEEEVMSNDIDPLDAIRELRKEEGVPEEDLPIRDDGGISDSAPQPDEKDDLDAFDDTGTTTNATDDTPDEGNDNELQETSEETDESEADQESQEAEEVEIINGKAFKNGKQFIIYGYEWKAV